MSEDMAKRVAQYVQIRDALKRLEEDHKKKCEPLLQLQEVLAGRLRTFMETNNLESLKTDSGTCYTSVRYTASLQDPDAFMTYVITNGKFDLLDRRANATAVRDFIAENKAEPPGCKLNAVQSVGVRRAPGSK
jgi:hypothetical protein